MPLTPEERKQVDDPNNPVLVYFQPAVLAQYKAESHKYRVELSDFEGEVNLSPDYSQDLSDEERKSESIHLKFGFRKLTSGEYCLAAFVYQFGQYSEGHIERWRPYVIPSDRLASLPDVRFEQWAARYLFGSWEVENNVIVRIEALVRLINAVTTEAFGSALFEWPENPHLHTPLSENSHAYQDSHKELYGYLVDGLQGSTIDNLIQATGITISGSSKQTRKRLEAALPRMAHSKLWAAFSKMSNQRGEATHKVRKPATKFAAFETFIADLEDTEHGLNDLKNELESVLKIDGEKASGRQSALLHLQRIDRPMQNSLGSVAMQKMIGRTVSKVEFGLRKDYDEAHSSDVILIHFTDGSILGLDTGSNACNVSSRHGEFAPSEFDVYIIAQFVAPPQKP